MAYLKIIKVLFIKLKVNAIWEEMWITELINIEYRVEAISLHKRSNVFLQRLRTMSSLFVSTILGIKLNKTNKSFTNKVIIDNNRANALYKKLGFEVEGNL